MSRILLSTVSLGALLACAGAEREVVVTRDQYGEAWPLEVNSARVLCPDGDDAALLQLGPKRYALTPSGREAGYPDAREVAAERPVAPDNPALGTWPADTGVLSAACNAQVASGS